MARSSRGGWLLYVMVCIPWIWKFKVGITSLNIGAKKRASDIDREMFGFPIPIMIVPVPGAWFVEQEMHRIMRPFKTVFYKGSGRQEWFNFAPVFFALPIMFSIWGCYIFILDLCLGTKILPVLTKWFFDLVWLVGKTAWKLLN